MELLERLQWRYAAKALVENKKVPQDVLERILEAARLAPTSSGLQPYEIFVVTNQEIKNQIRPIAWNQSQVTDCSHLLVFAAWDNYTEERINYMFDLTNKIRGFENEGWEMYRQKLLSIYPNQPEEQNFIHAAKQSYIGFMAAITAAAFEGVDATPMEGFDPEAVDTILNLRAKGLRSTLLLPIGYRDSEKDWLVSLEKIRRPMNEFVTEIK